MKKNMLFVVALLAMMVVACEKDDDSPAYVGVWETIAYDAVDPISQTPIKQKIEFDFETNDFEALVYNNAGNNVWINALGVRGGIDLKADTIMDAELNSVGINATGTSLVWYSKDVDEEEALFNQYIQLVSTTIPTAFEATYKVDGDKMDLIIPAAQDTIHLYKK